MTAVARRTDPATSWAAASSVVGITAVQRNVLYLLDQYGPMTDEEIGMAWVEVAPRASESGIRTRRKELVDMGRVIDTGKRKRTRANRQTIVWGLPPEQLTLGQVS